LLKNNPEMIQDGLLLIVGVGFLSPLFLMVIYLRSCLESAGEFKYTAINRALLNTTLLISPIFAWSLGESIGKSVYIVMIIYVISLIVIMLKTINVLQITSVTIAFKAMKRLTKSGLLIAIVSVMAIILYYLDRYIISYFFGLEEVLFYVVAYDLISRLSIVYGSLTAPFFPAFAVWKSEEKNTIIQSTVASLVIILGLVIGITSGLIILFSDEILAVWLGFEFVQSSSLILQILTIGFFFTALLVTPMRVLLALGYEKLLSKFYMIEATGYLLLCIFLVEKYGGIGAAIAFTIKSLIEFIALSWIFVLKEGYINNKFWRHNFSRIDIILTISIIIWMATALYFSESSIEEKIILILAMCTVATVLIKNIIQKVKNLIILSNE
jgi:O-antigen/teichoic acid export membrane protein